MGHCNGCGGNNRIWLMRDPLWFDVNQHNTLQVSGLYCCFFEISADVHYFGSCNKIDSMTGEYVNPRTALLSFTFTGNE